MTCARVREFNSKPPEVVLEPKIFGVTALATPAKRQKTTDSLPNKYNSTVPTLNKTGNTKIINFCVVLSPVFKAIL